MRLWWQQQVLDMMAGALHQARHLRLAALRRYLHTKGEQHFQQLHSGRRLKLTAARERHSSM